LEISSSCHPVRKLASVCGKITSLGNCIGRVSRLMSRNLFAVIKTAPTWNSYVRLSSEALAELNLWKSNVTSLSGIPISPVRHKQSTLSILMLLAQLAAVSSSSRARCSIRTGQNLRKLKVLLSEPFLYR